MTCEVESLDRALRSLLFTAEEELEKVMDVMSKLTVAPGERLITQGDHGDKFFVIESGQLEVMVNQAKVGDLKGGDHFGELALIYEGRVLDGLECFVPGR